MWFCWLTEADESLYPFWYTAKVSHQRRDSRQGLPNSGTHRTSMQTTTCGTWVLLEISRVSASAHHQLQQVWKPQSKVLMYSLEAGRSLLFTDNFTDDVDTAVLQMSLICLMQHLQSTTICRSLLCQKSWPRPVHLPCCNRLSGYSTQNCLKFTHLGTSLSFPQLSIISPLSLLQMQTPCSHFQSPSQISPASYQSWYLLSFYPPLLCWLQSPLLLLNSTRPFMTGDKNPQWNQ